MPFQIEIILLWLALAENVPDGLNSITTLTSVCIACTTHAVHFERASVNAVILISSVRASVVFLVALSSTSDRTSLHEGQLDIAILS